MESSPSINGTNYAAAATHPMTLPTGTGFTATTLPQGSYVVTSSTDGYLAVGGASVAAVVPSTRAAAAAMPSVNGQMFLPAGVPKPFDVRVTGQYISGIAVSIAGTIVIEGPILR